MYTVFNQLIKMQAGNKCILYQPIESNVIKEQCLEANKVEIKQSAEKSVISTLHWSQQRDIIFSLWPYMLPLALVYFAEYAMQAGAWTAIGFPVKDAKARHTFYEYAGFAYQLGVFISRSSGTLLQLTSRMLLVLSLVQMILLGFFCCVAAFHIWYNWSLLIWCFIVGLCGGAVYVNAFTLIAESVDSSIAEFALSAASVADTFGILLADIAGVFLQGCLYSRNGIPGANINVQC